MASLDQLTEGPTAIVNAAHVDLLKLQQKANDTGHFFALATHVLAQDIRDYRRRRGALRRGHGIQIDAETGDLPVEADQTSPEDHAIRNEALERRLAVLEELTGRGDNEARAAEVYTFIRLKRLSTADVAAVLDLSEASVLRALRAADAYLKVRLGDKGDGTETR